MAKLSKEWREHPGKTESPGRPTDVAYIEGQKFLGKCEKVLRNFFLISTSAIRQELNSWLLAKSTTTTIQQQKLKSSLFSIFILRFLYEPTHVTTHDLQHSIHVLLRSTDAENIRPCESFVTTGLSVQEELTGS